MFRETFIRQSASLLDALKVIDATGCGAAIAVDENETLIGILSDGDIRRAILKGASLHDSVEPYLVRDCLTVPLGTSRANVLELMQARKISQIPIINERWRVVGLHLLHKLISSAAKPNPALIMAGGRGSRLGDLTKKVPKPMLKVAGRPILERLILHLLGHGIQEFYLSVNYLSEVITDYFGYGKKLGCSIRYLHEDMPLGSGGALSLMPEQQYPVVVMNGDLISEANITRMLEFHQDYNFYVTIGCSEYTHEIPFGCLEEENGCLCGLQEKPIVRQKVNAGIYVLSPEAIKSVPANTFYPMTNLFEQALLQKKKCGVYSIDGNWIDIGQREQLNKACYGE